MNDLYKQIEMMIKRIQDTGKVKIVSAEFRYFSESTTPEEINEPHPYSIPASILEFYREIDFVTINWYVQEGKLDHYLDEEMDIAGGYADIPAFEKLLKCLKTGDRGMLIDPTHSFSGDQAILLESYVPFDFLDGGGAACFTLNGNVLEDNLVLVKTGIECLIEPLETGCRDYFNTGCSHYFFSDWQQALYLKNENKRKTMDFYLQELSLKIN